MSVRPRRPAQPTVLALPAGTAVTSVSAARAAAVNPLHAHAAGKGKFVASAQANNQVMHGHTLVWHNQTPSRVQGLIIFPRPHLIGGTR